MENNELRFRKHIRLKQYDYSTNGAYFITICTKDRKPIITDEARPLIEEELKALERRFPGIALDYYAIMGEHLHFIINMFNSETTLAGIIQAFKSLTTLKIKQKGYPDKRFWQPNYYEHVIRNEKALNKIRKYIVENPLVEQLNWKEIEK